MTKREKIRILKAMLPLIDTMPKGCGLCRAYLNAQGQTLTNENVYSGVAIRGLASMGIQPPKNPFTPKGDNQRRAAIRRAIKRLQTKKK